MGDTFFTSLVHAHGRQLARFFAARVSEPSEVQDLVQEVYVRLLKLERPELIRNPRAYLYRVAANLAREQWLKRLARPPLASLEALPAESMAHEDRCDTAEHVEELTRVLGELPPKVAASIVWAHRDGHTYREISARLSVPQHRVRKYLARGLAYCRRRMVGSGSALQSESQRTERPQPLGLKT